MAIEQALAKVYYECGRWQWDLVQGGVILHQGLRDLSKLNVMSDRDKKTSGWAKDWEDGSKSPLTRAAKFCRYLTKD